MVNELLKIYSSTGINRDRNKKLQGIKIEYSYNLGPKVEISGPGSDSHKVTFTDKVTGKILHSSVIKPGMWTKCSYSYAIDWLIEVENLQTGEKYINSKPPETFAVINESPSIGDLLAWVPVVEEFAKKVGRTVDFYTPNKELFLGKYENVNFLDYSKKNTRGYDCTYELLYSLEFNQYKHPIDCRTRELQTVAADILGVVLSGQIKPKLNLKPAPNYHSKYICICMESTSGCKEWQNKEGWSQVVKYVSSLGYRVVVVQKKGLQEYLDEESCRIVMKASTETVGEAGSWISGCEFFIGLGSGMSWMAWALNKPAVLISGFSLPFAEFYTPYRVINTGVCHGCWNDTKHKFDSSDWNWCPRGESFECSKEISFEMVKEKIDLLVKFL